MISHEVSNLWRARERNVFFFLLSLQKRSLPFDAFLYATGWKANTMPQPRCLLSLVQGKAERVFPFSLYFSVTHLFPLHPISTYSSYSLGGTSGCMLWISLGINMSLVSNVHKSHHSKFCMIVLHHNIARREVLHCCSSYKARDK